MVTAIFDTLAFAKRLKSAGVPDRQAEEHAEAIAEILETQIAPKQDIKHVMQSIEKLEYKLLIKFGIMLVGSITILATILKLH